MHTNKLEIIKEVFPFVSLSVYSWFHIPRRVFKISCFRGNLFSVVSAISAVKSEKSVFICGFILISFELKAVSGQRNDYSRLKFLPLNLKPDPAVE